MPWLHVVVRRLSNRARLGDLAKRAAEVQFLTTARAAVAGSDPTMSLDVARMLAQVADRHRQVLLLLIGGAQSREIAERFGVRIRDVGQMVCRARKSARRLRNGGKLPAGES
jgi:DNA-directed RNA polymerase specialized sigma24 family protein